MAKSRAEMAVIAPSPPPAPLDNAPASAETATMPAPSAPANCGQMTITLIDNGTSLPVPFVTFNPVGRFTERMMEHYLTMFAQEIQRAQAKVRYEQAHGPAPEPAPLDPEHVEELV